MTTGAASTAAASTPAPPPPAAPAAPRHVSGLWHGEAAPSADAHLSDVPTNPITWALTLLDPSAAALSAFGCGFFDDAGDVPGEPVLMYTLRGEWAPDSGDVALLKEYTGAAAGAGSVRYAGRLVRVA